jgi:NTE family protein
MATLGSDDVLIRPALGDKISSAGFDRAPEAIVIGYEAALDASKQLARYSVSEADYARYRQQVESCVQGPAELQFVEIENSSRFSNDVIERRMALDSDKPVDQATLQQGVERVYGLGFLDLVRHEVVERDGRTGAVVTVDQDARGTNFIEWGIDLSGDGDDTDLDLRVGYLKTDVDEYGSEFRVLTQLGSTPAIMAELYKALGPELRWFLRPKASWENRDFYLYNENGNPQEQVTVRQTSGEFAIARELGDSSTLWGGLRYYDGQSDDLLGTLPEITGDYQGGEYILGYDFDSVDDRYFPRDGMLARFNYSSSQDSLGADEEFDQLRSVLLGVHTFGRHTLIGRLRYNTTLNGEAPYYAKFRAGGLFELSGYAPDQIGGDHYGIALASWRYEVLSGLGFFPAQAGVSVEYGNAADDRDDIFDDAIAAGSLYFGYNSPIGPLYWGVGFAEGGEKAYFLRIGDVFTRGSIVR